MRDYKFYTILDAKAATGIDKVLNVKDFRHLVISIGSASSADLTVKAQGSIQESQPTFTSAQSVSNLWDYLEMVDLQSGSKVEGDTGVVFSGTDDFRMFEINTDGLEWLCFRVTARTAGSVTVKVLAFKD